MEYTFPISAINRAGETRIFYDAEALWSFIREPGIGRVGGYWREAYTSLFSARGDRKLVRAFSEEWCRVANGYDNDWILRDDRGRVVDKEKIPAPPRRVGKWTLLWDKRQDEVRRAAERGDAIPYVYSHFRRRRQGAWSKNGKNGAHNQRKGIKLYEDPKIKRGEIDDL